MKKTNLFIITMLIIIGLKSNVLAYVDTSSHWAEEVIDKYTRYKIVNGYENDNFNPDNNMTRAEFIVVLNRMFGFTKESQKYIPDISRQDYFYSDVRRAVEAGIIKGESGGYIKPFEHITREEAIVILYRTLKMEEPSSMQVRFEDEDDISIWAQKEVYAFVNAGYIKGYLDNTIRPKNKVTRAEAITMLNRLMPNVLTTNVYSGEIIGNTIVYEDNVVLNNLTIKGNLMIRPSANTTTKIKNVNLKGNFISISEKPKRINGFKIDGEVLELQTLEESTLEHINEEYGIKFTVTDKATISYAGAEKIDFKEDDLVILDIKKDNGYYLKNILTIGREESSKYANTFSLIESGEIDGFPYVVYDDKEDTNMIVIKRDNVVYTLISFNIVSDNFVDNILSTIELLPSENVNESKNVIYKNSKLSLKFTYKDIYVSVDDSYNTGIINEADAFFKLFIQVTTITDIQKYSINELKVLLRQLAQNDGKVLDTDVLKVMGNDAIKFKIEAEDEKIIYSLYIVVENNLYNFIFKGHETGMEEVGEEIFNNIIKTVEF